MAFSVNESRDDRTIFATRGFAIFGHIGLASLANGRRAGFAFLLEFGAAIRALDHRKRASTFLAELLSHGQFLKGMSTEAFGASEQGRGQARTGLLAQRR